jgi:hypothetical protein
MIETNEQIGKLLTSIAMKDTRFEEWKFGWKVTPLMDAGVGEAVGWHVQCSFERPDVSAEGATMSTGYGRKWLIERGTPDTGVVFTAWLALQQIVIHELHESFTVEVDGECVRLLDPHKTLTDLAHGSRRV